MSATTTNACRPTSRTTTNFPPLPSLHVAAVTTPPRIGRAFTAPADNPPPSPQERMDASLQADLKAVTDTCQRMGIDPDSNKGLSSFYIRA